MIRAILVVGWAGVLLLLATAGMGYAVADEESARHHMVVAMFCCAALLLADLCLLTYLQATLLVVRRTVAELRLSPGWEREYSRLAGRGTRWSASSALLVLVLFASGFPTFSLRLPVGVHHALAGVAVALQVATLWTAGRLLRRGEERLASLGRVVEEGQGGSAILRA